MFMRTSTSGKLYFIKIGGSIITDTGRSGVAKRPEMRRLFKEVLQASRKSRFRLLIGHGSGSFAHIPAKRYRVNEGLVHDFSTRGATVTHLVAERLNTIFVNEGVRCGLPMFPFSPSSFGLWNGNQSARGNVECIREALRWNLMPVTYGDVVMDRSGGVSIASTERVFDFLAGKLKPDRIILATDVDGVFDKDPRTHDDAKLIRRIDRSNIGAALSLAGGSHKVDVTGGMNSKLAALYRMVCTTRGQGIITNGLRNGSVRDALLGRGHDRATVVKP